MKDNFHTGRLPIALAAILLLLLGCCALFVPDRVLGDHAAFQKVVGQTGALRILGASLAALALTLLCLLPLDVPEVRRRIIAGLHVGTGFFLIAVVATALEKQQTGTQWLLMLCLAVVFSLFSSTASQFGLLPTWRRASAMRTDLQHRWQEQIVEAAAQQERNRLARDLHDSIKQQLFSIRVAAATVEARWESDPAGAKEALRHVRQSVHEATVEMQALLLQLRPAALANVGLIEALREQCEAQTYRTGARVELEVGELPPDEHILPATQETLFRIAQEALSNIARHARASEVRVWLGRQEPERLVLEIRDDGRGFDPAGPEAARGMGLRNLNERIQTLGGSAEIASTPEHGTTVRVILPLSEPDRTVAEPRQLDEEAASLLLLTGFLSVAAILGDETLPPILAGILLVPVLSYSRRVYTDDNRSWITGTALERIYSYCATFWVNPLFRLPETVLGAHSMNGKWLSLGAALLSAGMILFENWNYWQRRRKYAEPLSRERRLALPALLLAFLVTIVLAFLVDSPGAVARWAVGISTALSIAWWMRRKL